MRLYYCTTISKMPASFDVSSLCAGPGVCVRVFVLDGQGRHRAPPRNLHGLQEQGCQLDRRAERVHGPRCTRPRHPLRHLRPGGRSFVLFCFSLLDTVLKLTLKIKNSLLKLSICTHYHSYFEPVSNPKFSTSTLYFPPRPLVPCLDRLHGGPRHVPQSHS